jgi:hypothetical protein
MTEKDLDRVIEIIKRCRKKKSREADELTSQ